MFSTVSVPLIPIFFIFINDFKILLVYVTFVDDSFTNEEFINT